MQHWHNFHPPETHTRTHTCVFSAASIFILFLYTFSFLFSFLSVSSGYLLWQPPQSRRCLWETRAAAASTSIFYYFPNPKSRENNISDVYRTHIMRIISIDHFLGFLKLYTSIIKINILLYKFNVYIFSWKGLDLY